jgi:phosphoenolpyruvate phosphomutase
MKALILNSGLGHRMGVLTSEHPKCMTEVSATETILSRQLRLLAEADVSEVVMTTGYFDSVLVNYCHSLHLPLHFTFVNNPLYRETNYIYSIYCAREHLQDTDLLLMHGDLVFEPSVLDDIMNCPRSCMKVSSTLPLPDKDFKAVVKDGRVQAVGIEFFDSAMEAQALYKLNAADWKVWLDKICDFCEHDNRKCYAEKAFNEISDRCPVYALDVQDRLCSEIDTPEDLAVVSSRLWEIENRTVYLCFSTDIIHSGHIAIIRKARKLGRLIVGVLSDEAIASYRRPPLVSLEDRLTLFRNIKGIESVIVQNTLSYADTLRKLKPAFVVHGDNWRDGVQRPVRDEVTNVLAEYGGRLVEFPYDQQHRFVELEQRLAKAML